MRYTQPYFLTPTEAFMSIITWNDSYNTGHAEVDRQHQELFVMVNVLHQAIIDGKGKEVLGKTLDGLATYVVTHFKTEEGMMVQAKYPGYQVHKAVHDTLTKQAVEIIEGYTSGTSVLSITLSRFLSDWLQHHIDGEDKKMIAFIRAAR